MPGPQLTTYEWDTLLTDEQKVLLHSIVRQPAFDKKSKSYGHKFGDYRNGNLSSDPLTYSITGYGSPYPQRVNLLPIIAVGSIPLTNSEETEPLTSGSNGDSVSVTQESQIQASEDVTDTDTIPMLPNHEKLPETK